MTAAQSRHTDRCADVTHNTKHERGADLPLLLYLFCLLALFSEHVLLRILQEAHRDVVNVLSVKHDQREGLTVILRTAVSDQKRAVLPNTHDKYTVHCPKLVILTIYINNHIWKINM